MNKLCKLLADNRRMPQRRFEIAAKDDGSEAEIFLYDAIVSDELEAEWFGGVAPQSFVKALREITASTIHLRINSPGGAVFGARAIEQALREHPANIIAHIDGLAAKRGDVRRDGRRPGRDEQGRAVHDPQGLDIRLRKLR